MVFSDFAAAWTIFGNITVANGSTSHSNARDNVPAATYGAISSPVKYAIANIVSEVNMNWHAPNPNVNGTTCFIRLWRSNRSDGSDHKSRDRQMTIIAESPTPIAAPAIMPVAPKPSASTRNAAIPKSPALPSMVAQPSQKKSCRPCTTPENMGTNKDTSSSDSIMKTINKTTTTLKLMISAIAVISLIVGGIGVMNIMLVSVSERTHEIGIRMAVGARQEDIMQQFLIESVLVCLLGGMIGIVCSWGVGKVFSLFVTSFAMQFSIMSIVSAFLCSTLIGVIFGFLPARNAARLDPIEALARE